MEVVMKSFIIMGWPFDGLLKVLNDSNSNLSCLECPAYVSQLVSRGVIGKNDRSMLEVFLNQRQRTKLIIDALS
jgi:hypothetical protein